MMMTKHQNVGTICTPNVADSPRRLHQTLPLLINPTDIEN